MKIAVIYGKIAVNIAAETYRALLSVQNFVSSVLINRPIHDVKRKAAVYRIYYGVTLFIVVDEFALIFRADIQLSVITYNSVFAAVCIAVIYFAYGNFM